MFERSRRTAARRLSDDTGNILISVIMVSLLIGILSSLALKSGSRSDWFSASDRNSGMALGTSEAGINKAISKIEATAGASFQSSWPTITGSTPQGAFTTSTFRCVSPYPQACIDMGVTDGFVIDGMGTTGTKQLHRGRHLRVSLVPPALFPDAGRYALFSYTSIDLKNNDTIGGALTHSGDIWANTSLTIDNGANIYGSVTSATSWITTGNGSLISGNAQSGGYDATGHYAMSIGGTIDGNATSGVTAPSDPSTCAGETHSNYNINLGSVGGSATTLGTPIGGTVGGARNHDVCTAAPAAQVMPPFVYNRNNYDPNTLHEFSSIADYYSWRSAHSGPITGTFLVNDSNPSQSNRLDLGGVVMSNDLTFITNAPIYASGISDSAVPSGTHPKLVLVSHYAQPDATACDVNHDGSDCSIHVKNHLDASCKTATLFYADKGPVALKNNADFCGSVISNGILLKNGLTLNYDDRMNHITGFGNHAYDVGRWEEIQ